MGVTDAGLDDQHSAIAAGEGRTDLRPHTVLSRRYRLEKRIRVTAESDVYRAHDALLQRSVTIELPSASRPVDDAWVYLRQVASALHHRNIVATLDLGDESGMPYVVTEHFVGESLRSIIGNEAPFDVDDVAILIEQLAQGLAHAHQRGIVHGGLSPELIIIDSAGLAKITGFGMIEGQMFSETGTRAEMSPGPYLPPHVRGNSLVTQSLDTHALAAIAFEMLTGSTVSSDQGYYSPSVLNAKVPSRAGDTILHGLRAYDDRTGLTATEFSHALTHWRSWAAQQPPAPSTQAYRQTSPVSGPMASPSPAFSWPVPSTTVGYQQPEATRRSVTSGGSKPAILRWLAVGVLALSIASGVVLYRSDSPETITSFTEIPADLDRLLQSISD